MIQPQIVEKPALTVVGMEESFISALSPDATNFKVIGPLWDKFVHQAGKVPNRVGNAMYGVIYGRPPSERSHPEELQYVAAVAVSAATDVPQGMTSRTIPAGKFAVFTHRGPITKIADTCAEIYRDWLPNSGFQHSGVADVELYDHRFNCDNDQSEMEYWISIREKTSP